MYVNFLDLRNFYLENKIELDELWFRVQASSDFILGKELLRFEDLFSKYLGDVHCLGVANGLDAISLALEALNIGYEDEVIVPAHTFIATWLAVSKVRAKVIPVDVEIDTFNINPALIEAAISKKTKAIIVVHLYGQMASMDPILQVAKKYNITVIEDAAQAHGALTNNKKAGTLGDVGAFSFYPGKNLGCMGDGGAVVVGDTDLYQKIKLLRNYGSTEKYIHLLKGMNSRLDEIQAGFLSIKLAVLDLWNAKKRQISNFYNQELSNIDSSFLTPVCIGEELSHVWHQYVIRTDHRDQLRAYLDKVGVQTLIHYPVPPFLQKAYIELNYKKGTFLSSEKIAKTVLSLPIGPYLSQKEAAYVVQSIKSFFKYEL